MHELNGDEKELLGLLLNETPRNDAGVDCLAFRAKSFEQIQLIDRLESEGYIRKDQDRYFVSLTALVQLDNEVADCILQNAGRLFGELRHHYKATQREAIQVDALAERAGVDTLAAREALSYMVEGTWWGGRSTSFFSHPDPHIQPSETILRFETFGDVINQLRSWQASRIRDRQLALANALRQYSSTLAESQRPPSGFQRQMPDWFDQLPESPRDLLIEIYTALAQDLRALPAMGVRAVIDVVCVTLVGDGGSFENKLNLLKGHGHISDVERAILSAAIDAGSASAHRGYVPSREDLTTLLDIVEHLLQAQYILPDAVERMKSNTPSRPARKGNKQ
ncbi:MAG: DUF4145 domain-containing protein [Thiobacillus sp.]